MAPYLSKWYTCYCNYAALFPSNLTILRPALPVPLRYCLEVPLRLQGNLDIPNLRTYLGTWTVRVHSHLSRVCIRWETYKIHMMSELLTMPSRLSLRGNLSDTDAFT